MTQLSRIFRYWILLTGCFILLATAIVSGAIFYRTWQTERDLLQGQRQLLERYLIGEYAKICEEVYLKLDNWDARRIEINSLLGHYAKVGIEFDQHLDPSSLIHGDRPIFSWTNSSSGSASNTMILPLYFADRYLGSLRAHIEWKSGWSIGGFGRIGVTVGVLAIGLIGAWIIAFIVFRRLIFAPLMEQTLSINRHAAIAEAVQMLAHDIRKPFASLRMCLTILQRSEDPQVMRRVAMQSLPEVGALASDVESMLAEILDSERPGRATANPYPIAEFLRTTVKQELSSASAKANVELSFDLVDNLMTTVDSVQLRRIICNIARNAVEATHGHGRIWVNLRAIESQPEPFCEIRIGNSGDPIPANDIPNLFDSYFTRGKTGGTGLGLAIAKKFVTANGGSIWCESWNDRRTEFIITLPCTF